MSITEFINILCGRIRDHFRVPAKMIEGFAYRKDETGEAVHMPTVYPFTVPTAELSDGMPKKTPCVVVTVPECVKIAADCVTYRVRLALCVCYPGISSDEWCEPVGTNEYEEATGDENSDSGLELIKTSFLFSEQILRALDCAHDLSISEVTFEPCDADLQDYPYAVSAISFTTRIIRRNHLEVFY